MGTPAFLVLNNSAGDEYQLWPFELASVRVSPFDAKVYVDTGAIAPQSEFVAADDFATVAAAVTAAANLGPGLTYFAAFTLVGGGYFATSVDAVRGIRQDPANVGRCYIATASQNQAPVHVESSASDVASALFAAKYGAP